MINKFSAAPVLNHLGAVLVARAIALCDAVLPVVGLAGLPVLVVSRGSISPYERGSQDAGFALQ